MSIRRLLMVQNGEPLVDVEGQVPISIESKKTQTANDYKIFGDGEVVGVGDKQEDGTYKIPVNVKGRNLFDKNGVTLNAYLNVGAVYSSKTSKTFVITCKPRTKYTLFCDNTSVENPRCVIYTFSEYPDIGSLANVKIHADTTKKIINFTTLDTDTYIAIWNVYNLSHTDVQEMLETCMLVEGEYNESNFPEYEPYRNETKTIYLNSPILQGDYTSLKEQKVFRNDGTTEDVVIPPLELAQGTNIVDVETIIKPEKMSIKARGIKPISV